MVERSGLQESTVVANRGRPSGLKGAVLIAGGGSVWEMEAQAKAFSAETDARALMFTGSPDRILDADERNYLENKFGGRRRENATEHNAAFQFACVQADKSRMRVSFTQHFGYRTNGEHALLRKPTGQLRFIGETTLGQSVHVVRADISSPDLLGFIADTLTMQGDRNGKIPIALITSREDHYRQAILAGLGRNRLFGAALA